MKEFELEKFPTSESAKRQISYVSEDFYEKSYIGKWLFQVIGLEYDDIANLLEELPSQMFPETATWGLKYHEIKWNLPVRENLPYEERRKLIYQKRDLKAPMTPYRIETYLTDAVGFQVQVSDIHDSGKYNFKPKHPNVFQVTFIGEGTLNVKVVKAVLDKLKQSHTMYILNDRVILIIDNKYLENFKLTDIKLHMKFLFWKEIVSNTKKEILQSKLQIHTKASYTTEEFQNASVSSSKNLWRLNGSVKLNGSRKLNAEYKEEEL